MKLFIKIIIFSVLSTTSVFLLSFSASAQSSGLKPLGRTSTLNIQCTDNKGKITSNQELTTGWYNKIFNNGVSGFSTDSNRIFLKSSFDRALSSGYYGIYQYATKKSDGYYNVGIHLFWTESRSKALVKRNDNSGYTFYLSEDNAKYYSLRLDCSGYAYPDGWDGSSTSSYRFHNLYSKDTGYSSIYYYNGKIVIDKDIEDLIGVIPGDPSGAIDSGKKVISPEFEYKVTGKKVELSHLKDKDEIKMSAFSKYTKDGWRLKNDTYQVSFMVQRKKSGDVIASEKIIDAGGSFSVEVTENDEYVVTASYKALAFYSYGVGSATPDYCINAYPDDTDEINYQSKHMYLNINGDDFSGSTLTADCKFGFCEVKPKYEDCSVHDLNIKFWDGGPEFRLPSILSIGCTINNSFKWAINEIILPLIMPSQDFLRDKFGELQNNLSRSFGFLWTPVTLIQTFYNGVINNQISGDTCALPPMSMFGSTATIHLCSWRYQLPGLWRYMQLAIQGGLVTGLIWSLYSLAMRFFGVHVQDDDDDGDGFEEVRWRDDRTGDVGEWERRSKK